MSKRNWVLFMIAILLIIFAACSNDKDDKADDGKADDDGKDNGEMAFNPPSTDDLDADDPATDSIKKGEKLFNETNTAVEQSGNELSCASCHADGGAGKASPVVGSASQFPTYRPREDAVFSMEDRINGCMVRSMNGEKLPADSEELRAMTAYITYLSKGFEVYGDKDIPWRMRNTMKKIPEPDVDNGKEMYTKKNCASCHAEDGSGTGPTSGPALWGDDSFNDGAGMGRLQKMAGFIQNNMPVGEEESLSDQESADLAAYLLSQKRPEWKGHDKDWPAGGRPTDIITKDRREKIQDGSFDWTEIDNIVPAD